jgi:hypothetical protein
MCLASNLLRDEQGRAVITRTTRAAWRPRYSAYVWDSLEAPRAQLELLPSGAVMSHEKHKTGSVAVP